MPYIHRCGGIAQAGLSTGVGDALLVPFQLHFDRKHSDPRRHE